MISFTPLNDSKRRKRSRKSKCEFLIENKCEGAPKQQHLILMQLNIYTEDIGSRLEHLHVYLRDPPEPQKMEDMVLTFPHFSTPMALFSNQINLKVQEWNCSHCF